MLNEQETLTWQPRTQTFKFCSDDCAAVPEDITLEAYAKLLHGPGKSSVSCFSIYLLPS